MIRLQPGAVSAAAEAFTVFAETVMVYGDCLLINEDGIAPISTGKADLLIWTGCFGKTLSPSKRCISGGRHCLMLAVLMKP